MSARTKETVVEVDGAEIGMRFDFNAVCNVEDLTGKNLLMPGALDNVTGNQVRALVYGCHLAYHQWRDEKPQLNLFKIGGLIDESNAESLLAAIKSLQSGAPVVEEGDGEGVDPPVASAGT